MSLKFKIIETRTFELKLIRLGSLGEVAAEILSALQFQVHIDDRYGLTGTVWVYIYLKEKC